MNEKILAITEAAFNTGSYSDFDGYIITTDKQEIKIGISNGQGCCEQWGYFMSEDDLSEYIGAGLTEIKLTDTKLNTKAYKELEDLCAEETALMFVDFITDRGTLQFVAYNCHNGYYGHDAIVISEQLKHEEGL